jgi:hypothetical protein
MSSLNLTAKQIESSVTKKLALTNVRGTREQHGDFYLDGKFQFTVTMPNIHGGSGSISTGWLKVCRESTRLKTSEFADLVRCPMSGEAYEQIIRKQIRSRFK